MVAITAVVIVVVIVLGIKRCARKDVVLFNATNRHSRPQILVLFVARELQFSAAGYWNMVPALGGCRWRTARKPRVK